MGTLMEETSDGGQGDPSTVGAVSFPSTKQGEQGRAGHRDRSLTVLIVRQRHSDGAGLGSLGSPSGSEGSKAQPCLQGGYGQKQPCRGTQKQSYLQRKAPKGAGAWAELKRVCGPWGVRVHKATKAGS